MTAAKTLDPRTKLIMVLCLSSLAVFIQDIYVLGGVLLASFVISVILKGDLFPAFKQVKRLLLLIVIIAVIQSLFAPAGKTIITIGTFPLLTTGGLIRGAEFILRMAVIVVSATIVATSSSRETVQGLVQWKIPYEIAFMVSVGIRFLPMLTEEIRNVMLAIQLRGVELDKIPFRKKLKIYSYILTPIVVGTVIRAQKLATAMETRAFRAYPRRTSYMTLKMALPDYAIISFSILVSASVVVVYYM
ncbi:MAG: energy-coupling factor transporter transmembrane component T family protein [Dehalococcoidia bacterium]|nr:Energy-coupling factor transporter transmembrane protein EcfT [Chloroflexota bacterium]MBT9161510.1 Energy-coupling factor transporter transmembrane protein EcfT [Chloroflexota bacterium]